MNGFNQGGKKTNRPMTEERQKKLGGEGTGGTKVRRTVNQTRVFGQVNSVKEKKQQGSLHYMGDPDQFAREKSSEVRRAG